MEKTLEVGLDNGSIVKVEICIAEGHGDKKGWVQRAEGMLIAERPGDKNTEVLRKWGITPEIPVIGFALK